MQSRVRSCRKTFIYYYYMEWAAPIVKHQLTFNIIWFSNLHLLLISMLQIPNQIAYLTIHLKKPMILDNVIDQLPLDDIELIIPCHLVPPNWDIHCDVGLACSHEHEVGVISLAVGIFSGARIGGMMIYISSCQRIFYMTKCFLFPVSTFCLCMEMIVSARRR